MTNSNDRMPPPGGVLDYVDTRPVPPLFLPGIYHDLITLMTAEGTSVTTTVQPPIPQAPILPTLTSIVGEEEDPQVKLWRLLQAALQVEFSTIPPYLTAMYSIRDKTSRAYLLVRSIAMEEMVHLNLVSNLLNAVGGEPTLVVRAESGEPKFPPKYPVRLSDEAAGGGPYLQLMAMSRQLVRETFMRIEQPAQPDAPPQPEKFSTIGQLYLAIKNAFAEYEKREKKYGTENQSDEWNFGNNGGTVIKVGNYETAIQAINEIIEQGEGADLDVAKKRDPRYHITQPWGQYEYYGPRTDGTYGPVLGTPLELSHYFKFREIADGTAPLPATYPMVANPSVDKFDNPLAKELGDLFNLSYSLLVDELQKALRGKKREKEDDKEKFFTSVVPLMRVVLPVLATQLMQVPVAENTKPHTSVDPTAGPPFYYGDYGDDASLANLSNRAGFLADQVATGKYPSASATLVTALRKIQNNL